MTTKNYITVILPFLLLFAVLAFIVSGNSFFWDTVQLGSKHAHWFYENNFRYLLLPDEIDSGHTPVFGMYLALMWKIFGKTLIVSHWAMFPFIAGIIFQAARLLKYFISEKFLLPAIILFMADATLLAQCSLISPDVALVFFFLTALNSVLYKNKITLFFSVLGLSLISMRGMMAVVAILLCDFFINLSQMEPAKKFRILVGIIPVYIGASLIAVLFMIWHYIQKGWIGYHSSSNWAPSFEIVDIKGFMRNILVLGWRLADFGRIFTWLFIIISCIIFYKRKLLFDKKTNLLISIILICFVVFTPTVLLYRNLSLHRYLLPIFLMITLFAVYILFEKIQSMKLRYILFSLLFAGLITGNFWIYPDGIAEGWDSTLAHLPYYKLRKQMLNYMDGQKIPVDKTGSAFPNLAVIEYIDLNSDQRAFVEKDLAKCRYILQSNIYNDFTNNELKSLKTDFRLLKEYKKCGIYLRLYETKEIRNH